MIDAVGHALGMAFGRKGGLEIVDPRAYASGSQEADHEACSDRHRAVCDNWPTVTGIRSWWSTPFGPFPESSAYQWATRRSS